MNPLLCGSEWPRETPWERYFFKAMCNRIAADASRSSPEWRARYIAMHRENIAKARACREAETAKIEMRKAA